MRTLHSPKRFSTPQSPRLKPATASALLDALLSSPIPARPVDFQRGRQLLARVCGDRAELDRAEQQLKGGLGL